MAITSPASDSHQSDVAIKSLDGAEPSQEATVGMEAMARVFPGHVVSTMVDPDLSLTLRRLCEAEIHLALLNYRRQLMDIFGRIEANRLRSQLQSPQFGFRSLCRLKSSDSNNSGAIIFSAETRELCCGVSVNSLPKNFIIKVSPYILHSDGRRGIYTGSTNHLRPSDPSNVEVSLLVRYRRLVLRNVTPCIGIIYRYCIVEDWTVSAAAMTAGGAAAAEAVWRPWHAPKNPGGIRKQAMVMILEHCREGSLKTFIKVNNGLKTRAWRAILFQQIFTLAVLDDLDGFRHNDMHLGNWGVHACVSPTSVTHFQFIYKGHTFWVPNVGVQVRLIDMDWATSSSVVNGKVRAHLEMDAVTTPEQPAVFDVHRILDNVHIHSKTPKAVKDFVHGVYGKLGLLSRINKAGGVAWVHPAKTSAIVQMMPTCQQLLFHPFFSEFTAKPACLTGVLPPFELSADEAARKLLLDG